MCNQEKAKKLEDAKRIVQLINRAYEDTCASPTALLSCVRVPMPDMYHVKIVIGRLLKACDMYISDLNDRVNDTSGEYDDWLIREFGDYGDLCFNRTFGDYGDLMLSVLKGEHSITYVDPVSGGPVTLTLQLNTYPKIVDLHVNGLSVFTLFLQHLFEEISGSNSAEVQDDFLKFYHPDSREEYKSVIEEIYKREGEGVWFNA